MKKIPYGFKHVSSFPTNEQIKLQKDNAVKLIYFSAVHYEQPEQIPLNGMFYGPFVWTGLTTQSEAPADTLTF